MRMLLVALGASAALGVAGCTISAGPVSAARSSSASPAPTITKTVIKRKPARSAPAATPAPGTSTPAAPVPAAPTTVPNVTDPWAVVSAYYGDIESGNYQQAWALLSYGMVTGQTYRQFVDGFACTGGQQLTDLGESGDQVRFNLAATDDCTGVIQHFTGVDTVESGKIVAADVRQVG